MTNMQFYIALAVPSILVFLSWMQQDKRLARLEATIDKLDARVDRLELKVDARFERLEARIDARFDAIDQDLRQFYTITGEFKGRVDELARR